VIQIRGAQRKSAASMERVQTLKQSDREDSANVEPVNESAICV